MSLTRRRLLKALAAAPTIPLLQSSLARAMMGEGKPSAVYILLHGMFFLEFTDDGYLWVASPDYSSPHPSTRHKFYVRRHGRDFKHLSGMVDLTGLSAGNWTKFPDELPQFPKSLLSRGDVVLPKVKKYACMLKLRCPQFIFPWRTDDRSNFHPDKSTRSHAIADALIQWRPARVATITCMQYAVPASGGYVESYYAEHCDTPGPDEVNEALREGAGDEGFLGAKFDLQMTNDRAKPAKKDADNDLPSGVTQADENELSEFIEVRPPDCSPPVRAADVASCPQFGLLPK